MTYHVLSGTLNLTKLKLKPLCLWIMFTEK